MNAIPLRQFCTLKRRGRQVLKDPGSQVDCQSKEAKVHRPKAYDKLCPARTRAKLGRGGGKLEREKYGTFMPIMNPVTRTSIMNAIPLRQFCTLKRRGRQVLKGPGSQVDCQSKEAKVHRPKAYDKLCPARTRIIDTNVKFGNWHTGAEVKKGRKQKHKGIPPIRSQKGVYKTNPRWHHQSETKHQQQQHKSEQDRVEQDGSTIVH